MPSPDHPSTPTPTGLPDPTSGVGAADLATSSTDPDELRSLLERARERLAFYESFDRIIGENIRRSGELMVETVALREQAQSLAAQSANDRAEFAATQEADRTHYRSLVQSALDEAATVRPAIDAMVQRLEDVLEQLDTEPDMIEAAPAASAESGNEPASIDTPAAMSPEAPNAAKTTLDDEPLSDTEKIVDQPSADTAVADDSATLRTIQVLAHEVPNARIAVALQKMLREIEPVQNVEAREFANGELRLAVTATGSLSSDALATWLSINNGELTSISDTVTEITFRKT